MKFDSNSTLQAIDDALNTVNFVSIEADHREAILKYIKYFHDKISMIMKLLNLISNIAKKFCLNRLLDDYVIKVSIHEKKHILKEKANDMK